MVQGPSGTDIKLIWNFSTEEFLKLFIEKMKQDLAMTTIVYIESIGYCYF